MYKLQVTNFGELGKIFWKNFPKLNIQKIHSVNISQILHTYNMRFEIEKIKMKFSKDYFWILHKISLSKIVIHNTRTYFQSEILILENFQNVDYET